MAQVSETAEEPPLFAKSPDFTIPHEPPLASQFLSRIHLSTFLPAGGPYIHWSLFLTLPSNPDDGLLVHIIGASGTRFYYSQRPSGRQATGHLGTYFLGVATAGVPLQELQRRVPLPPRNQSDEGVQVNCQDWVRWFLRFLVQERRVGEVFRKLEGVPVFVKAVVRE